MLFYLPPKKKTEKFVQEELRIEVYVPHIEELKDQDKEESVESRVIVIDLF